MRLLKVQIGNPGLKGFLIRYGFDYYSGWVPDFRDARYPR
jgi:hypothetical protein